MTRMISEQEKREKRQRAAGVRGASRRAKQAEHLVAQGYDAADAAKLLSHVASAKSLVGIAKQARRLLSPLGCTPSVTEAERLALRELEKALVIAAPHNPEARVVLELLREKLKTEEGAP